MQHTPIMDETEETVVVNAKDGRAYLVPVAVATELEDIRRERDEAREDVAILGVLRPKLKDCEQALAKAENERDALRAALREVCQKAGVVLTDAAIRGNTVKTSYLVNLATAKCAADDLVPKAKR